MFFDTIKRVNEFEKMLKEESASKPIKHMNMIESIKQMNEFKKTIELESIDRVFDYIESELEILIESKCIELDNAGEKMINKICKIMKKQKKNTFMINKPDHIDFCRFEYPMTFKQDHTFTSTFRNNIKQRCDLIFTNKYQLYLTTGSFKYILVNNYRVYYCLYMYPDFCSFSKFHYLF